MVEVENPVGRSIGYAAPIRALAPGIFFGADKAGAVAIANTGLTTFQRAAAAGDVLEIYATGLGATRRSTAFPSLQETAVTPQVLIGGVPARVIVSTTLAQFPGGYQVNAVVPAGLAPGDQSLVLVMDGVRSNEVRIRVQ